MEHDCRHIPNRLRHYRKLCGYTQKDVAILLNLGSTARISLWERGLTYPSAINLIKLSVIYRTIVNELYYDHWVEFKEDIAMKKPE
ncbi:helix-turn-helix domain-containing protein [Limnovirga soli]|uniref:Helix-turn-helix domain-containing protein n=1 Tax=Limnovirga soli TaxID=2656915 RepID=A0A8J8FAA8_9BACT|nr:helix-turn-helix domain-containing protein [Limnovirga soli]